MVQDLFGDYYIEIQRGIRSRILRRPTLRLLRSGISWIFRSWRPSTCTTSNVMTPQLTTCCYVCETNAQVHDDKRLKMAGDYFYLRSPEEVAELFADLPEAVENTARLADECELELEFGTLHLPEVPLPVGRSAEEHLASLCWRDSNYDSPSQPRNWKTGCDMSWMSSARRILPITFWLCGT